MSMAEFKASQTKLGTETAGKKEDEEKKNKKTFSGSCFVCLCEFQAPPYGSHSGDIDSNAKCKNSKDYVVVFTGTCHKACDTTYIAAKQCVAEAASALFIARSEGVAEPNPVVVCLAQRAGCAELKIALNVARKKTKSAYCNGCPARVICGKRKAAVTDMPLQLVGEEAA